MENEVEKIVGDVGKGIETGAKDVAKVAEVPFTFAEKAKSVLEQVIKEKPALRGVIEGMVVRAEQIGASIVTDATSSGLDLASDAATMALVQSFFGYFKSTVEPVFLTVYSDLREDLSVAN